MLNKQKTESGKSLPKKIEYELCGKTYVIKKMHVGKYALMLGMLENLPEKLMEMYPDKSFDDIKANLGDMSSEDMIRNIPMLMQFAANEVMKILAFATGIPVEVFQYREDMDDEEIVGLDEILELVDIVLKLNNFGKIADQIKNLMTLRQG